MRSITTALRLASASRAGFANRELPAPTERIASMPIPSATLAEILTHLTGLEQLRCILTLLR